MLGISLIFFLILYLLLCLGVAYFVSHIAKLLGMPGRLFGGIVFLAGLGLVFWDWMPMEILHTYKCANNAGFTQYKTLDQWKQENPGVWETLRSDVMPKEYLLRVNKGQKKSEERLYKLPSGIELVAHYDVNGEHTVTVMTLVNGKNVYRLNQRFYRESVQVVGLFNVRETEDRLVDMKSNETMARHIDFDTDYTNISLGAKRMSDYKIWMYKDGCEAATKTKAEFSKLVLTIMHGDMEK